MTESANAPAGFAAVPGSATLPLHVESEGVGGVLPPVLDVCCGSRMFWFNKRDSRALFVDERTEVHEIDIGTPGTVGRKPVTVNPDVVADFTALPFASCQFSLVVFDPPHLDNSGTGIINKKYGVLRGDWREMLAGGFSECFRVLKPLGVLVFKWATTHYPLSEVLALTPNQPLFGHLSGKKLTTHWVTFLKGGGGGFSSAKPSSAATSQNKQIADSEQINTND